MEELMTVPWWAKVVDLCDEASQGFFDDIVEHFYPSHQVGSTTNIPTNTTNTTPTTTTTCYFYCLCFFREYTTTTTTSTKNTPLL
jgi:hypothetical protein